MFSWSCVTSQACLWAFLLAENLNISFSVAMSLNLDFIFGAQINLQIERVRLAMKVFKEHHKWDLVYCRVTPQVFIWLLAVTSTHLYTRNVDKS